MPMLLLLQGVIAVSLVAAPPQDSAATIRHLRTRQRSLEWRRRNTLPRESGGGGASGPCDARIGKYCYWVGDGPEKPKADAPALVRWRSELIAALDTAAARFPADAWIAAARVRYLAESGDAPRAIAAARDCAGSPWCGMLLGYALHLAGRYAASDSAFDSARTRLPRETRCAWDDLRPLLTRAAGAPFGAASCAGRDLLARHVWWLATPLFLAGANDLRTEYFSRRTRAWIERDEASAQFLWWDDYIPELWARYGWPAWLTRSDPPVGSYEDPSIIGHDPTPSFAWIPSDAALRAPFTADESAWSDVDEHGARMRYAPPWLHAIDALPHQLARFRRGDSLRLVASYDGTRDSSFHASRGVRAGLIAGRGARSMRASALRDAPLRGALSLSVPAESTLVSVELWSPDDSAAARARRGVAPLSGPMSDLLLYDATAAPSWGAAPVLDDVVPLALAGDTLGRDRSLGVYWEFYRDGADTTAARVAVALEPAGAGWLRRALWKTGLVRRATAVRLRWAAPPRPADPAQSVALDLSALPAGSYRLTVSVEGAGQVGAATRTIVLR